MSVTIRHIGKSADDLRFFISFHGQHAGGITVHGLREDTFSYGIAISPSMRQRGIAKAALPLLFAQMRSKGFRRAVVQIAASNAASLALHRSLGFECIEEDLQHITMALTLTPNG